MGCIETESSTVSRETVASTELSGEAPEIFADDSVRDAE
jgi:hypothetical protein